MGSRPELQRPPELFYNESEAKKYNSSSRMVGIQAEISNRCIELLNLPQDKVAFILDVGCGSGLSGEALEEHGHVWLGIDISRDMLDVANERNTDLGDLCHHDMGSGLPFRPSTFDGCISVSALQWLCYAQTSEQSAKARLMRFFSSLYAVLKRGSRAALQFYPETPEQAVLISSCAASAGFTGGLVVDYPHSSKAKKYYLCLSFEHSYRAPTGLLGDGTGGGSSNSVNVAQREKRSKKGKGKQRENIKDAKDWVLKKKERQRKQGKEARPDSKYTGRKRKDKF